ncbi:MULTISPECIES: penicillin-binding protein 2 [Clostridia]|uniref:peptidoglycan D,D-transpeptidase FtsI family protein n=1 Tax=Clostridia TaxID=186801 RepID=UPI000EA2B06F|nr:MULTISPECIES: penicillin-binding protein 2 [Clostridia]NBJ69525.1 penicillin-binding protein 2 [Roseburia sp. 1XD42-34]RKI78597.1 penicillin-binding protein 2 [Clostridium sp. 1xD42-85]
MTKKKKREQISFRVNIVFLFIFILFAILILQLGIVQILHGEKFQDKIEQTIQETAKISTPRGKMYDRNYQIVVDNEPVYAITYTPPKGIQAEDRLELAKKLSKRITMVPKRKKPQTYLDNLLTERDLQEYVYLLHKKKVEGRLPEQKRTNLNNGEAYHALLDLIKKEEMNQLTVKEKEIIAIKKQLDKATEFTPHIIKNEGVTKKEYASIAENLTDLPGINATTDWNRAYPYGESIQSLFGNISSHKEGLPLDQLEYYLTLGYSRNDRVGTSGLEKQYEDLLQGRKEQMVYETNKHGEIVTQNVAVDGQRGKDLVLTIDMELQQKVDTILREEMKAVINKYPYENRYMQDALAVVIKPKTGDLLAVSGQRYDQERRKFYHAAHKAIYNQHIPGSVVKGATVLAGLQSGVIQPGERLYDIPMKIKGTPEKSSYTDSALGWLNDLDALKRSSNVYMFYTALRMGGEYNYQYNQPVSFDPESFQQMRNYFHQFGLGITTAIDFPNESTGYKGANPAAGNLMDFAIGQYDTYTVLQLAQYVSTIANDGYRVRPHFLKEVRTPKPSSREIGPIFRSAHTTVLNRVEMKQEYIKRVQEGFRRAFQEPGGTAYTAFNDKNYDAIGKTGTAENTFNGDYTENLSLIGYAPKNNPEVAFAVVVPHTGKAENINLKIGERMMDAYFNLKENRGNRQSKGE